MGPGGRHAFLKLVFTSHTGLVNHTVIVPSYITYVNSFRPSPSREIDDALGSCVVFEGHLAFWHISCFRKGACMRLWSALFEITT